ncbi:MAG: phosphatase PAP2 family protein [Pseudomonadales bacterium]|jgi:undecaprenyl-diphosphatase
MKILEIVHEHDVFTFDWVLQRTNRQAMIRAALLTSKSGDGPLYAFAAAVSLLFDEFDLFLLLIAAFALERTLYTVFKKGFKRNRPANILKNYKSLVIPSDEFSFPSGHTSASFLMATLISVLVPVTFPLFYIWALAVGSSRVILGVHFPTDILAGATLGTSVALITLNLFGYL